jgi:hypothetical protein
MCPIRFPALIAGYGCQLHGEMRNRPRIDRDRYITMILFVVKHSRKWGAPGGRDIPGRVWLP